MPLAATLAALATISPCQDPALAPGCPDLVVARPTRLSAQRLDDGRTLLRMRNRIINAGTAPAELADLAWLFNMNRGIFMTPGREEEWTLSVTHTDESVDRYVAVFEAMADELMA